MKDKKKMILNFLKNKGQQSETNISIGIRSSIGYTRRYLLELESDNKIKKMQTPTAIYWELKEAQK